MPIDYLQRLRSEFAEKVGALLTNCAMAGVPVRIVAGLRTPLQQAKLWRQGRNIDIINQQIETLKTYGCPYLAACIDKAGPQNGPLVTKAIPGLSWHNFGEAIDVVALDSKNQPITNGSDVGYANFQEQVTVSGLFPVGKSWQWDSGHCQYRQASSPLAAMTIRDVDSELAALAPLS